MKKCHRCGTPWKGFRGEPRAREVCDGCGAYLHSCTNCNHFDREITHSCKLPNTAFVGGRNMLNYCDDYRMIDSTVRANENRVVQARATWEQLFKR